MHAEDEPAAGQSAKNHRGELIVSLLVCGMILLGPLIYIEYNYAAFTDKHGEPLEGAAGAGLALAVVFRTVSRTVLRTVIRTSARAGMRASFKSVFRSALRVSMRGSSAGLVKRISDFFDDSSAGKPQKPLAARNRGSLWFASVLLFASWIIVIGIGQPYASLMTRSEAETAEQERQAEETRMLEVLYTEARTAWEADQEVRALEAEYDAIKQALKQERDIERQAELEENLNLLLLRQNAASRRLSDAREASGGRMLAPDEAGIEQEMNQIQMFDSLREALFTYAPFPGPVPWSSPVIWLGGLIMVLPMWLIFFVQRRAANNVGGQLRHETGVDGGLIQLYFAGAFSFMPLTSDVIVDGTTPAERGRIALAGLVVPTLVSLILWGAWRLTGNTMLVFAADAFLIHPMVQIFPLSPLEGQHLYRYSRLRWFIMFILIMFLFLSMGSEALRSVI